MANTVQLVITALETGKVQVSGPIHDKLTCYALLEAARDAIKDHTDQLARSAIVQASPGDLTRLHRS